MTRYHSRRLLGPAAIAVGLLLVAACVVVLTGQRADALEVSGSTTTAATVTIAATTSAAATSSAGATASATTTAPTTGYLLDFTLPTYAKSGCMVCHGDPNLVVSKGTGSQSFWIDEEMYAASAHGTVMCTGCHIDYGYTAPHKQSVDFKTTAKQACKGCHPDQFADYSPGSHAIRPTSQGAPDPKAAQKPLCGDCHGSHYMPMLTDNPEGQESMDASAAAMCGRAGCHQDYWDNYMDYYHGAALKAKATDAPPCWDCHGAHLVLPTKNQLSPTNTEQLGETCGKCHEGANENYQSYIELIHGKENVEVSNPVNAALTGVIGAIGGLFGL